MAQTSSESSRRRWDHHPVTASAILLFYIATRMIWPGWIDRLGDYASYIFEGVFAAVVMLFYRKQWHGRFIPREALRNGAWGLAGGAALIAVVRLAHIWVPFAFRDLETILGLLLIGPLLEEALFRQALFWPARALFARPVLVIVFSALMFSAGHLYGILSLPAEYRPFVIFQAGYTFLLGIWWGHLELRTRSYWATVAPHFGLNLGFLLAGLLLT